MIAGNIYGVVLNDATEREALGAALTEKPYGAPPMAPVVYQKPLASIARGAVTVPEGGLVAATTVAVLFARDVCRITPDEVQGSIGAAALAIDFSTPNSSYYRPAIAHRNADGRLVLGDFAAFAMPESIALLIDDNVAHEWPTDRLVRGAVQLISDLSQYMTLLAGDVLMIGLPGDAALISGGQTLAVIGGPLPPTYTITTGAKA
ncbi:fumarylacetoacetate hydrolase family protein [Novosphingobium sp.]|uniref:fumarylacetoacetate hydrolase family protein n=1 Tax=Novosphingobium sp. TaxID=1874826 RepID=UPI0035640BED